MSLPRAPRAVVTGAGSGLGREFSVEIGRRRGRVIVSDIREDAARETAEQVRAAGGEAQAVLADVGRADQVEALASAALGAFGGADLLINNAGVAVAGRLEAVPLADWEWIIRINLLGVVHGCRAFVPLFKRQNSGAVLNVASAAGLVSLPEMSPYNATKAAVVALSETLSAELASTPITVTVLCPTFFPTQILRDARAQAAQIRGAKVWMDRARWSAADVARAALDAVDRGRLYAVPMADGRLVWTLKRVTPAGLVGVLRTLVKIGGWERLTGSAGVGAAADGERSER
jgi:short-subunit dehydrogenase